MLQKPLSQYFSFYGMIEHLNNAMRWDASMKHDLHISNLTTVEPLPSSMYSLQKPIQIISTCCIKLPHLGYKSLEFSFESFPGSVLRAFEIIEKYSKSFRFIHSLTLALVADSVAL